MDWVTVLTLLLKLASAIASIIREKGMLEAGRQQQLAADLAALSDRLGIVQQVSQEIDAMSPGQIDEELRT